MTPVPGEFLAATEVVDYDFPEVRALARALAADDATATARRCFVWVRDEVRHSLDHGDDVATVTASEALRLRTGLCYAKSHLLAALLRANGIPAGFGYQRLSLDGCGPPFTLHAFNAVLLPVHGWVRLDARGNRPGLATDFAPPADSLAFVPTLPGERTFAERHAEPLPEVVAALRAAPTLARIRWPDLQ